MKTELPISAFAAVNKVVRLRCSIEARIKGLMFQFRDVLGSPSEFLSGFTDEVVFLQSLLNRLDINSLVCNGYVAVSRDFKVFPKSLELHSIKLFGSFTEKKYDARLKLRMMESKLDYLRSSGASVSRLDSYSVLVERERFSVDAIERYLSDMAVFSALGRRSELVRRLGIEIQDRARQGWFFVFNTLTVRPEFLSRVFPNSGAERSSAFSDYVRAVDRYFGIAAFGSVRNAAARRVVGEDYHSYFAVVEKGSSTGRLHIHVLHCFKALPADFSDPNFGASVPYYREVSAMKSFWSFGFSSPCAVRFSGLDSFAGAGWRWPVKADGRKFMSLPSKPFGAIIGYISKYITKSYADDLPGCVWRTRLSRNLGSRALKSVLSRMPLKERLTLLSAPKLSIRLFQTLLPTQLIRRLLLGSLPVKVFLVLIRRSLKLRPIGLLMRLRAMIAGIPVFSLPRCSSIRIRTFRVMAVSRFFDSSGSFFAVGGPSYV